MISSNFGHLSSVYCGQVKPRKLLSPSLHSCLNISNKFFVSTISINNGYLVLWSGVAHVLSKGSKITPTGQVCLYALPSRQSQKFWHEIFAGQGKNPFALEQFVDGCGSCSCGLVEQLTLTG